MSRGNDPMPEAVKLLYLDYACACDLLDAHESELNRRRKVKALNAYLAALATLPRFRDGGDAA